MECRETTGVSVIRIIVSVDTYLNAGWNWILTLPKTTKREQRATWARWWGLSLLLPTSTSLHLSRMLIRTWDCATSRYYVLGVRVWSESICADPQHEPKQGHPRQPAHKSWKATARSSTQLVGGYLPQWVMWCTDVVSPLESSYWWKFGPDIHLCAAQAFSSHSSQNGMHVGSGSKFCGFWRTMRSELCVEGNQQYVSRPKYTSAST